MFFFFPQIYFYFLSFISILFTISEKQKQFNNLLHYFTVALKTKYFLSFKLINYIILSKYDKQKHKKKKKTLLKYVLNSTVLKLYHLINLKEQLNYVLPEFYEHVKEKTINICYLSRTA